MDKCKLEVILIIAVVAIGVACGLAVSPAHADDPYKWPVIPPMAKMPHPNARDFYDAAVALRKDDMVAGNGWLQSPQPAAPRVPQAQLDQAAEDNLPLLAKVREGFQYPYAGKETTGENPFVPLAAYDRDVARIKPCSKV